MIALRSLLLLVLAFFAAVPGAAAQDGKKVMLRLYADADAAVPGRTVRLAIEQTIAPGWHTYWMNPGDSGEPMKIKWDLPGGAVVSPFLWPAPDRVPYGPLMNFGYMDRAIVLSDVTVPAQLEPGGTFAIRGRASVLVCDEICIPESHDVALDLPLAAAANPANGDLFAAAAALIPQPVDWSTVTEIDADEVRVRVTLPDAGNDFARAPQDIAWFPLEWGYIENASDQTATFEPTTRTLTLRQSPSSERDVSRLEHAPYLIRAGDSAVIVSGDIRSIGAAALGARTASVVGPDMGLGVPLLLVFAFVGGLILNLMPCVFPVLSMKALHLVSLPAAERAHARASGLLYALGVVAMFVILAAVMFAIRAGGAQLGWGFQLQNPAMVAALAWLLFLIGLNLSGVFDLRVAFGGEMILAEKHHPLLASFLTGVLATLVATPCTAPFMATALGAALVQPVPVALGIFAMVGLGLAFPYLLLCFVPALQGLLPRPGAWMETFRQVLAFPMFASAVWLVWVVAQQGGADAVGWTLYGMVALSFAIWLVRRRPASDILRRGLMGAGLVVMGLTLAGLVLIVPVTRDGGTQMQVGQARPFDTESFDHALNDGDDPIFVNMTASWCITCLVNEKVTLNTPEIHDLFSDLRVTYFKGDWTNQDQAITAYLQRYGRTGVPLYVYYGPRDAQTGKRPDAVVLPQILTVDMMRETIR